MPQGFELFHGPGAVCSLIPTGGFQMAVCLLTIHTVSQPRVNRSPRRPLLQYPHTILFHPEDYHPHCVLEPAPTGLQELTVIFSENLQAGY